jgi:hypothetical protein
MSLYLRTIVLLKIILNMFWVKHNYNHLWKSVCLCMTHAFMCPYDDRHYCIKI